MTRGRYHDPALWHERIRLAREVHEEGGSLRDVARRWGTSPVLVSTRLRIHAYDLHREIVSHRASSMALPVSTVIMRLHALRDSKTLTEAARRCGVSLATMHVFRKKYAPDGVADALSDYEYEDAA